MDRVKQFGEFECEFESTQINIFAPKNYFYFKKTDDGNHLIKSSFKGVNMNKDCLIGSKADM